MPMTLRNVVFWIALVSSAWLLFSCGGEQAFQRGAGGDSLGSLIDKDTTWRGGAIGAGLSKPLKGRISEIAVRASGEAAREGRPTAYLSIDGFQRVEAYPLEKGSKLKCSQVREQIYQGEKLFQDEMKEVCQ